MSELKFRKKPVVIEAIKWTGDNLREIIDFTGLHPSANKWTWDEYEQVVKNEGLKIFTLEGSHMATIGDMIIKGVQGEFYPCKPDIFEQTYESAGKRQSPKQMVAEGLSAILQDPNERVAFRKQVTQQDGIRHESVISGMLNAILAVCESEGGE